MKSIILVPTDFTKVADSAILHAVKLAKNIDGQLVLLHILSKGKSADEARTKVEAQAAEIKSKHFLEARGVVRIGNIFEDIGDAATENGAKFIVMGTHGVKGMQHITGSHALKVITQSDTPFIVVQEKGPSKGMDNVVVPMDMENESKQKLKYASEIAQYFHSKVHIVAQDYEDEFISNKVKRNIQFAKTYLAERNVSFTVEKFDSGDFDDEIVNYSVTNGADLICIMNHVDSDVDFFANSDEQKLITNQAQIPVMVINPKSTMSSRGGGLFS